MEPTANDYTYWLANTRTLIRKPMDETLNPERLDLWSLRWVKDPDLIRLFRESPFELDPLELPLAKKMERQLREQFSQDGAEDAPVNVGMPDEMAMADEEAPSESPVKMPNEHLETTDAQSEAPLPPGGNTPQIVPEMSGGPGVVWHVPGDVADGPDSVEDDGESMTYNYDEPNDRSRLRKTVAETEQIGRDVATPQEVMAHDRAKRELRAILLSQKKG